MNKRFFCICLTSILLISCSQQCFVPGDLSPMQNRISHYDERDGTINMALTVADYVYPALSEAVRNGEIEITDAFYTEDVLEMVYPLYSDYASGNNDTIFHIFNFGTENGFAVCSQLYGVVAITNKGHLDVSDCYHSFSEERENSSPKYIATTLVELLWLF